MILPMQNGRIEITDIKFPSKSLILSGDEDKNLLLTVEVNGTVRLDTPAKLPPNVLQKLLSDEEVTPADLVHSGFFNIERTTDVGFSCIRFSFGTSEMDGIFVTVFGEHLTLAFRSLCDDSVPVQSNSR